MTTKVIDSDTTAHAYRDEAGLKMFIWLISTSIVT